MSYSKEQFRQDVVKVLVARGEGRDVAQEVADLSVKAIDEAFAAIFRVTGAGSTNYIEAQSHIYALLAVSTAAQSKLDFLRPHFQPEKGELN